MRHTGHQDSRVWLHERCDAGKSPRICSHCKIIGHIVSDCRDIQKEILEEEKCAVKENEVEKKQKKKRNRKKKQNGEGNKGNKDE
ncbi:hypothetical protein GIB67_015005, partial [Kingdonia uniflora]